MKLRSWGSPEFCQGALSSACGSALWQEQAEVWWITLGYTQSVPLTLLLGMARFKWIFDLSAAGDQLAPFRGTALCCAPWWKLAAKLVPYLTVLFSQRFYLHLLAPVVSCQCSKSHSILRGKVTTSCNHWSTHRYRQLTQIINNCAAHFKKIALRLPEWWDFQWNIWDPKVLLTEVCAHHLWGPRLHLKPPQFKEQVSLPCSICCPKSYSIPQLSSHHLSPGANSAAPLAPRLFAGKCAPLLCFFGPNIIFFFCLFPPSTGWQLFYHLQQEMLSLLCRQNICKGAGGTQKAVGNW